MSVRVTSRLFKDGVCYEIFQTITDAFCSVFQLSSSFVMATDTTHMTYDFNISVNVHTIYKHDIVLAGLN